MDNYPTYSDIGCKVKTKYGIGILEYVDAGAAYYVYPINENEEWDRVQFDGKELEKIAEMEC